MQRCSIMDRLNIYVFYCEISSIFFEKTIIAVQSQCLEYHFKGSSPCSIKILNAAFVSFLFVGRFSELFDFRRN